MLWSVRSSLACNDVFSLFGKLWMQKPRRLQRLHLFICIDIYVHPPLNLSTQPRNYIFQIAQNDVKWFCLQAAFEDLLNEYYWLLLLWQAWCPQVWWWNKLIIYLQSIILHRGFVGSQVSVTWSLLIYTVVLGHLKCWKSKSFRGKSEIKAELIPGELQPACIR